MRVDLYIKTKYILLFEKCDILRRTSQKIKHIVMITQCDIFYTRYLSKNEFSTFCLFALIPPCDVSGKKKHNFSYGFPVRYFKYFEIAIP